MKKEKIYWFSLFFYPVLIDLDLNFRTKNKIVIIATIDASPSETGMADQAPVSPKTGGRINKQGIRNKN